MRTSVPGTKTLTSTKVPRQAHVAGLLNPTNRTCYPKGFFSVVGNGEVLLSFLPLEGGRKSEEAGVGGGLRRPMVGIISKMMLVA